MVGKQISHYKVLEKLGEGGMGVVYKAEDTRLDRIVAIKFLPRHIAADEEDRKRFAREAKAAAALNHANIATIHAVEEVEDESFIVMEYIQGQELKATIDNRQLSIDRCLNYAAQVAEGLQAAHEKGVIHRDIKSANIMITERGQVKIMDFGLAKVHGGTQLTEEHSTLGTAEYMSPEQALGEYIDHRTDIWSFGVVLYEMLTGQMPFRGEYTSAILYAVLHNEPAALADSRADVPVEIEEITYKCLQKDREHRYQSAEAHDVNPRYSPDGHFISFLSKRQGAWDLYLLSASDAKAIQLTHLGATQIMGHVWSPDGKTIYITYHNPARDDTGDEIWAVSVDDGSMSKILDNRGGPLDWLSDSMATDGKRLFFVVGRPLGDIWLAELSYE